MEKGKLFLTLIVAAACVVAAFFLIYVISMPEETCPEVKPVENVTTSNQSNMIEPRAYITYVEANPEFLPLETADQGPQRVYVEGDNIIDMRFYNGSVEVPNDLGLSPPMISFDPQDFIDKSAERMTAGEFCRLEYLFPTAAKFYAGVEKSVILIAHADSEMLYEVFYDAETGEELDYRETKKQKLEYVDKTVSVSLQKAHVCVGETYPENFQPLLITQGWPIAINWLAENGEGGLLTWWDYYDSLRVFTDMDVIPEMGNEPQILEVAEILMEESEAEALNHIWEIGDGEIEYIVLDYSLVGKAFALSYLATPTDEIEPKTIYGQYQLVTTPGMAIQQCGRPDLSTSLEPFKVVSDNETKNASRRYLYTGYGGSEFGDGNRYPAFVLIVYEDGTQEVQLVSNTCEMVPYDELMALGEDSMINLGFANRLGGEIAPQLFIHVPKDYKDSMLTQLYLLDARDLEYFELVLDDDTRRSYPYVKIFKINYPADMPVTETKPNDTKMDDDTAKRGDVVEVDYVGKFENGTVFDSSEGKDPLMFTLGAGQVIRGFDDAVTGMKVGEKKEVTIPPERAYGTSGSHPLAGKTLVFEITLVGINPPD